MLRRPRFHLHFTPTSASWLNQVERWFAALTERQIRRGTHRSTTELERAIEAYLAVCSEQPAPFIWTKTADQILASLKQAGVWKHSRLHVERLDVPRSIPG